MKGSLQALAHPDDDLYDSNHRRYVLQSSPGIGEMKMLSFVKVMFDTTDNVMKVPDESRLHYFIAFSGSKMELFARNGAVPCSPTNIPTDLVEANCVPSDSWSLRDGILSWISIRILIRPHDEYHGVNPIPMPPPLPTRVNKDRLDFPPLLCRRHKLVAWCTAISS
jgi:hypothetical protein